MISVWLDTHRFKYKWFTPSAGKEIRIKTLELEPIDQFLLFLKRSILVVMVFYLVPVLVKIMHLSLLFQPGFHILNFPFPRQDYLFSLLSKTTDKKTMEAG